MTRCNIQNENREVVGWFDADAAITITEGQTFNGSNMISDATGSQWDHELLHLTKGGRWVLNKWSQWQGTRETYESVEVEEAFMWLLANASQKEIESLPKKLQTEYAEFVAGKEF